ncbi:dipeptidase PepV [Faecalicatena contorta]|uniref:dipeptidase PepV n=1 Tax=Faecalicatena contorta TaxID=39482 RepID=UPI001F32DBC6|nr:dipeptidase PepV [Faecalicatena contorta]MCF2667198.1 dipeptidase PepV [Faecalicatena contorta]
MSYEKLNEKILEMKDEMLDSIRESVAVCSVKGEPEPDAPYGKEVKQALDHALALGEKMGFRTGNIDNRVGYIEYGEGEEMVGVLGHLDVVPLGEGWVHDPLGCEVQDGKMYGRGVQDDKGPTIGAFYALKAIKDLGLPLDRRIRVLFGCDEECGSSCVEHYIKVGGELPTIGFTPDAQFPAIFCEKGQTFWYISKKVEEAPEIKVLSIEGGVAKNVVTPKCTLVAEGDLVVEEKDYITVEKKDGKTIVTAEGLSAHGSTPELGKNAAVRLFDALKGNCFGGDLQKMIDFIMEKVGWETNGASLGIASEDEETGNTTVNLGMIKYDGQELQFTLDIRYPKNISEETVVANVTKNIEAYGLEVENELHSLLYVPKDSELVQKLTKVYCEETGDTDAQPIAIGGGTYAKSFKNMVAFGPIFPGEEEVIHAPNEFAVIDNLVRSIQITAAAMYELAQK